MRRITVGIFALLFCALFVRNSAQGSCVPTYRDAAPETLDLKWLFGIFPQL